MKSFACWLLLPSLLNTRSVLGVFPLSSVKRESNLPTVPNKFIVEVDTLSDVPSKRSVTRSHELLYVSLKQRGVGFEVDKEFNSDGIFVGVALTLNDAQDVSVIQNVPGVRAIRAVRKFDRPRPVKSLDISGPDDPQLPPDSESTHIMTGVDKLHAQGITGTGVKVGILDTGIDYTHPALGGGFGPGHKVIGGFDFVGDDYDGTNTPIPDPDPLDQCAGHGTHVAGIIGADPVNPFNISGVAYTASISSYRVFGCLGSVTDDVLVEALLFAFHDGQDILTLSLGGADGWTESSSSVVASRIAASGKIVTIAAGNDGDSGAWYTSSPGNGIDVISVASVDNTAIQLQTATTNGVDHAPIIYFSLLPLPAPKALPIYATSNDTTIEDDACNPLPDTTPDLSTFLVIVRRGTCTFVQKIANIAAKGATIAFIYDNGSGISGGAELGDFQGALIQAADGEFLVAQFVANAPVTVSFPQSGGIVNVPDANGGLVSTFTSYGPSNDFFFKPAVAAPGGNIVSTWPVPLGSYKIESGTSMATPFMAGSAALLFSVKGKSPSVGKTARTLFETTAQRIPSSHTDGDPLQTVTQQGSGLVNVFDAIYATTIVSPGELILNDTAHFKGSQTFSIANNGKSTKKYKLKHVPAGTAVTVTPDTIFPATGPVPLSTQYASATFDQASFSVRPGQTHQVKVRFNLPKGNASTFPLYSGFIQITSGTENLHVSYIGLGAALKNKQVLDNTDVFFGVKLPVYLDPLGNVQSNPRNYTFANADFPTLLVRFAFGTPAFRIDLVDPNIKLVTTLNTRADPFPSFTFPHPQKGGSFAQVKIIGPLTEVDFISRSNEDPATNGFTTIPFQNTFANGTRIPNGSYRALVRALRVTGDPTKEEDYESFLSPIIGVTA